jgi:hypothetical protein
MFRSIRSLFGIGGKKKPAQKVSRFFQKARMNFDTLEDRTTPAATTLGIGDVAFTGYYGNSAGGVNERFSFVLLHDVGSGTNLNFTDNAWTSASGPFATNEAVYGVTFDADFNAGTSFYYESNNTNLFGSFHNANGSTTNLTTTTTGTSSFGNTGDNLTAYQGTLASPTVISAFSALPFLTSGTAGVRDTYLPSGLAVGSNAISLNSGTSNGYLNLASASGSASEVSTTVNTLSNWTVTSATNDNTVVPPATTFSFSTTTTLDSITGTPIYGNTLTFNGTVSTGAGAVEIRDGSASGTLLATGSVSGGTFAISNGAPIPTGSYNARAFYLGSGTAAPSSSAPPGTPLTIAKKDITITGGITANNKTYDGTTAATLTIGSVTYSGLVSPDTSSQITLNPGTASFADPDVGTDKTVTATGFSLGTTGVSANYTLASQPSGLTADITQASTTTSLSSTPNPSTFNDTVTLTATVAPVSPGAGVPTGTVNFFDGATNIGSGTLSGGSASFQISSLSVGSHSLTAQYVGSSNFGGSTSAATSQVVNPLASTTVLTSSVNPSAIGQPVTFTATVSPSSATGTVEFLDGATVIGSGTLSGGSTTFQISSLSVGTHPITAHYLGSANLGESTSNVVSQVVNQASTTTNVSVDLNPTFFGQPATFTATVAAVAPGAGTPTGTVNFFDGATNIGSATLSGGTATFVISSLDVGSHSITAQYVGATDFAGSTSAVLAFDVDQAQSTTSLSSSPNPSVFGQQVTLTATVAAVAPGAGTPTGTVNFFDGATNIGSGTLSGGTATFQVSNLSPGSHTLTAQYAGSTNLSGSTSNTVSQTVSAAATTTSITSSVNPSSFGEPVTFTATVAAVSPGTGTPTGTVNFFDGATNIGSGTLSGGTASFQISSLSVGTHTITAQYAGSASHAPSTASTVTQVVNAANTTTALTSSLNPSIFGDSVTFTATVSAVSPGAGTPTGSVTFFDGATSLGVGTLSAGGTATLSTAALGIGTHTITAQYGGASGFAASLSNTVSQVVNPVTTTTSLTSSANPSVSGQQVTFTATVSPSSATGAVEFLDGATVIGTGTLSGGSTTFQISSLSVGTHSITAHYLGSGGFNQSTSSPVSQVVNQAGTTTSVSVDVNPTLFGQPATFTVSVAPVAPGAGTPTGTVNFFDGATNIGSATLSGGTATFVISSLDVGSHNITAQYVGATDFAGSTSPVLVFDVDQAGSTTSLSSSPNPSAFGQQVTLTATVAVVAPGAGTPTGTVNFFDGATNIGSATLSGGTATFQVSNLSAGSHTLTAEYAGSTNFDDSVSNTVTQVVDVSATTTSLTSSVNPSTFGQSVTFTAMVTPVSPGAGTPTGTVDFFDGATNIGSGTLNFSGVATLATLSTSSLAVGAHDITAVYSGNSGYTGSTSNTVSQVVNVASTSTNLASSLNPSQFGDSVTFTATVSAVPPGVGTPTGTVSFFDGAVNIGSGTLNASGVATFSTSTLIVGSHSISAQYGGETNFSGSTSNTVTQVVTLVSSSTSLSTSPNPSAFGQQVTLTASVSPASATGTVDFLDGSTVLGTATLSGGTATFQISSLSVGAHSLTAHYNGSASVSPSDSPIVTQTVNKADTTTTVTASVNPPVFGQPVTFTATVASVAPGAGTPTGAVTFFDGATSLGSGTLDGSGVATFTTSSLGVGSHSITAQYGASTSFNGSTSSALLLDVDQANTTSVLSSAPNPSQFGETVTFTVTVSAVPPGSGTPTGTVNFFDGATNLGSATLNGSGVATFQISTLSRGTHPISAQYAGSANFIGSTSNTVNQVVSKKVLIVTATGQDKVYNGNTTAIVTLSDNRDPGDNITVTYVAANFNNKNVGNDKPITVTGINVTGPDADNYTWNTTATATADITPKTVTVSNLGANNKVYDGTTTTSVFVIPPKTSISGIVPGDRVNYNVANAVGTFADPNVGNNKPVVITGIVLSSPSGGTDYLNYVVAPINTTANITPRPLTLTANNRTKPQGTTMTWNGTEFSSSGLVSGQSIASASMDSPGAPASAPAGTYTINISNAVAGAGTNLSNYTVTYVAGTLTVS